MARASPPVVNELARRVPGPSCAEGQPGLARRGAEGLGETGMEGEYTAEYLVEPEHIREGVAEV